MKLRFLTIVFASLVSSGCVYDVFSANQLNGVERNFDFARWHTTPSQIPPTKIELGGRIIEAQSIGKTITMVAAQLPIVKYPAYGPKQAKSKGEFVIIYHGKIAQPFLHPGNRIMVVGMTQGAKLVAVDDVMRTLPSLEANCLHIWKTGNVDIADFSSSGAGYGALEEETFCSTSTN